MTDTTLSPRPRRVFLLGATGTIGRSTAQALVARGHEVVCFVRPRAGEDPGRGLPAGVTVRTGDVTDPASLARDGFRGERFEALVSCLASRTGTPRDAWAIDHKAQSDALTAARAAGVSQAVLLSAICVQKPTLAFQQAKLAFEAELRTSGLTWSIVRPTAFFKSLSGQVERVKAGKPFLVFGDGRLTACKPISDADLGGFIAECLDDPALQNRVLPIGGPGPAITPRDQGEELFRLLGREPKFREVPVAMMDAIIAILSALGRVVPRFRDKAEFARIGRYYGTESMLVLNPETGLYDAEATPEYGSDRLYDYYARLVSGEDRADLGEHAAF
ncbi:NAD(P)H-binding protein [Rhodovulum kholense]|uniref:Divinyl chlorophyllide a 8-vinyl-reductase, chloroplastic n=1 Tax=Rhodovulum kholense TaxID=453584 RepID=A0A8E2VQ84_9RHOB|nr:NAD(P)H-binding protein [Rhodovulum kholense]PTW51929.1 divinylchlorophyllide 8-vinylreductase [Rhodovulum kholense]